MAHDTATHVKARSMYEAGETYESISAILKVSERTLKYWGKAEKWVQGRLAPVLHRAEEDSLIALAVERGLSKGKVIDKVVEFMDAQKLLIERDPPDKEKEAKEEGDDSGGAVSVHIPDYKTQVEGTKMAMEILRMKGQDALTGNPVLLILQQVRARHNQ